MHFTAVDRTADPGFFFHFLEEANKLPAAIAWKLSILEGLGLKPGMEVLDVGCGLGDDAALYSTSNMAGRASHRSEKWDRVCLENALRLAIADHTVVYSKLGSEGERLAECADAIGKLKLRPTSVFNDILRRRLY